MAKEIGGLSFEQRHGKARVWRSINGRQSIVEWNVAAMQGKVSHRMLLVYRPVREFVGCVHCIRILSPTEVQQMSEEGMKLLNSAAMQGINGSASEAGCA